MRREERAEDIEFNQSSRLDEWGKEGLTSSETHDHSKLPYSLRARLQRSV